MVGNPWFSEQLAAQKMAALARVADEERLAGAARRGPRRARRRGAIARRVGHALVATGYRLGGPDALPALAVSGRRQSA